MDIENILKKYDINIDLNMIYDMWQESGRYYHNLDHLLDLINLINTDFERNRFDSNVYEKLIIVALFHDIIYDPSSSNNEEDSAEFLKSVCSDLDKINDIIQSIIDTKNHTNSSELSEIFNEYDMDIVNRDIDSLIKWEDDIFNEYHKFYTTEEYKQGRIKFINSIIDKYPGNMANLQDLLKYIEDKYTNDDIEADN